MNMNQTWHQTVTFAVSCVLLTEHFWKLERSTHEKLSNVKRFSLCNPNELNLIFGFFGNYFPFCLFVRSQQPASIANIKLVT